MRDVMIDLETFGNRPDAMVVAIGAVFFGPGVVGESIDHRMYAVIDPETARGSVDASTVYWWLNQGEEARQPFRDIPASPKVPLRAALEYLTKLIEAVGRDVRVWGHGSSFDIPIVENAYRACGLVHPWGHRAARDTRTILELADVKIEMPVDAKHNAMEDARAQAQAVIRAARVLGEHRLWPELRV